MPSTLWIDTNIDSDVASGATTQVNLIGEFAAFQDLRLARLTLLRTIVRLDIAATVHDSGEGSQRVSMGAGIASNEAISGNTTSDPEDASEHPTRGWIFRGVWRAFGFAADQPAISVREVNLDLRARRKLENGIPFLSINNAAQEGTAFTVNVTGIMRMLYLDA